MKSNKLTYILLGIAIPILFLANILYGAISIPIEEIWAILTNSNQVNESWKIIVTESRLPQAITALLSGSALAISGLLLQTLFRNPLAGPSILGISDGANLGVAIAMLALGGQIGGLGGYMTIALSALIGAMVILSIIIYFSGKVRSNILLLIIGIMVGYLVSSSISILNYYASADKVHKFVMWGMGDFSSVSLDKLPFFAIILIIGLVMALMLSKPMNALLMGENYASNLGVNIKRVRTAILINTGILVAIVTAFCGPISFIGIAVPHISRLIIGSANHRHLIPVTLLTGGAIALICNILTIIPGSNTILPLNAITPLFGAPVILYVIMSKKNMQLYN
ncbi:MAG: iron ABC transporter permease [Bacteroidales bacterium]|jgi:iron complex transport system permease protein|nr:iron ABC transporter permease [Bacteroidales bacterium]MBQ5747496.1 iron ABC transporter permease [Bacteroidales bacterium]